MVLLYHLSVMPFGWLGVDAFFVISGFLIGGIIIDRLKSESWRFAQFYRDRALRILPIYYLMIVLYAVLKGIPATHGLGLNGIKTMIASLVFAQTTINWKLNLGLDAAYVVDGSWSLVIEEFFYLVAPAFLFVIYRVTKGNLGSMLKLLCAVVAIFLIAKLLVVRRHSLDQWQPFFMYSVQFPFKMDELIIGLIAAIFVRNHKTGVTISGLLLCAGCGFCIGVIAFLNHTSAWREPYTLMREVAWLPTIFAGGVALLVIVTHRWRIAPAPVVIVARLSYTIYLGHILLFQLPRFWDAIGLSYATLGIAGFQATLAAASLAFAYLLSLLVEYPFLRLYRRQESQS